MLTKTRLDESRLAELLALMVIIDEAKPHSNSDEDIKEKLIELDESWHIRSFLAREEILKYPPNKSKHLRAGSFLDPIKDLLSKRLRQMNTGLGSDFSLTIEIVMDTKIYAEVSCTGKLEYKIEIGLALIVPLFLGAITLSQPDSEVSSTFTNPFQSKYGEGAAAVFDSQKPLLQALSVSAFDSLLPEEPWRRLLAYGIFSMAIEYAFIHEIGHVMRGHLEFIASLGQVNELTEGEIEPKFESLTHQLLEGCNPSSALTETKNRVNSSLRF